MSLAVTLLLRGLTLVGVLLVVLGLVVVSLGATGFSDRVLNAVIREEMRGVRDSLARTIRDPDRLEEALAVRKQELVRLYGLDRPWYYRLPDTAKRVLTLDLGEARTLRSSSGSARVSDILLERIPRTLALVT
ncbi:MAG: ABC transporter permease, partial [Chloroflexota bacterium]